MTTLTDQELIDIFTHQLPKILDERPELEPQLYHYFLKAFARKEEVAAVAQELSEFRGEMTEFRGGMETFRDSMETFRDETRENFAKVNTRLEQVHKDLTRQIDRLGSRWGIRNESLFRETVTSLLEKSFGARVETRHVKGEQFDLIISDGQHILLEIAASAERDMQERLERKRRIYYETTGVMPTRVVFAVASINSRLAQALRAAGIEVIEPEE